MDWLLSMEDPHEDYNSVIDMPRCKVVWHDDGRRWPDGRRWQDDGTQFDYVSSTLIEPPADEEQESQLLTVAELQTYSDSEEAEQEEIEKPSQPTESSKPSGLLAPGFPESLRVGNLLPTDQQEQFIDIITSNRDAFCIYLEDLATPCNLMEAHIDTGNATPVFSYPYKKSAVEEEALAAITRNQIKIGIVEPCVSPWASPAMVVPKKVEEGRDRSKLEVEELWRQVIDYRQLNEKVAPDQMPMPDVHDCLERAARGRVFSRLDLKQGFFQIPLAPESRPKTCFQTIDGTYQFTRLPQGLKTSPAAFVRAVTMAVTPTLRQEVMRRRIL